MAVDMSGYVDVATRIAEFREKHPDGCLRPVNPEQPYRIETIAGDTVITYTAAAYRGPDDRLPGIGVAQEPYPGRTPYTRGSEIQNAETSAWGRAIVAALAADTRRGVASADEVRNRAAEREDESPQPIPDNLRKIQFALFRDLGLAGDQDKQRRLDLLSDILKRPVTSANDQTAQEAAQANFELRKRLAGHNSGRSS
ncbi:MAG TPA: hypothetical protein VFB74_09575 [Kribbellaceae bacterium]|nr:hypothetical protein [Kribbellaceae bacterium]